MALGRRINQGLADAIWNYRKSFSGVLKHGEPNVPLRDVIVAIADGLTGTQAGFDRDRFLRHALEGKR